MSKKYIQRTSYWKTLNNKRIANPHKSSRDARFDNDNGGRCGRGRRDAVNLRRTKTSAEEERRAEGGADKCNVLRPTACSEMRRAVLRFHLPNIILNSVKNLSKAIYNGN